MYIAIYQETIYYHYYYYYYYYYIFLFSKNDVLLYLADMEGCRNKVFSLQEMSHCHKLRYRTFGVSLLKPNFLFLFISQYKKGGFFTNTKTQAIYTNHKLFF